MSDGPDIVIVGSGIGGATLAAALAPTGKRIVILERGERLVDCAEARDDDAIFARGHFRPDETWFTPDGSPFNPGNYYYVGGNSKFYGAVLIRYRAEDFRPLRHLGGTTPGWPITYDDLEPWYQAAEELFSVRGDASQDPTEPRHSGAYPISSGSRRAGDRGRPSQIVPGWGQTFIAAAWHRHGALARPRRDPLGCLPRHDGREDGRRERRRGKGARAPERHAGDRSAGDPSDRRARWSRDRGRVRPRERIQARFSAAGGAFRRGNQLGRPAAALGPRGISARPCEPVGSGRAQLHEPQLFGSHGRASAAPQ